MLKLVYLLCVFNFFFWLNFVVQNLLLCHQQIWLQCPQVSVVTLQQAGLYITFPRSL